MTLPQPPAQVDARTPAIDTSRRSSTVVPTTEPDPAAAGDRLDRLVTAGAKVIRVVHADLFGRQRAKAFPASSLPQLREGFAYSKMSIAEDLLGVPVDEDQFSTVKGHPDLFARIEPESAVVPPWEPDAVWVLSSLWEHGERSPLCARGALASARERLEAELGLTGIAAGEPEFYLFEVDDDGKRVGAYAKNGVSYTIDRITDPRGVVGRMHRSLIDFGIGVTVVNREFSPGQFEINLHHDECQVAADQAFLLKTAIKELAITEGLEANFMAKPVTGDEGSSLHFHLSLWDGDRNVFATDGATEEGLSESLRHAIAGLQAHAPAIMAFAAPTVNSYKRLQGDGLSPRTSNMGVDNRYAFVRIPPEGGSAARFELRAGDASASPHLLLAAMLHAARDGIVRRLEPTDAGVALPRSLEQSVAALQASELFRDAFGDELVPIYAALKRREIAAFESTVTDWEWNLYHSHV
ncbi:glutamine synthetase [Pseudoclavibacter endophyticus]|uniref:Glutamine synthetase n=1 Tax=Pseudoclavibacter endophyticus TaxID=1778590 RepID=A0A6H9WL44_9MICO|nr:glutamine synthetase family protein [Pseudoclavibacter endophyticus]KAB1648232.1 glutamine synthetase [Pseudoclavibacter endophyticus]GGA70851.1 glutamine synthetase [Pseudoclavibacter endophyticus]